MQIYFAALFVDKYTSFFSTSIFVCSLPCVYFYLLFFAMLLTYKLIYVRLKVAHKVDAKEEVTCISFSPDARYLAVGNRANVIDVYSVDRGIVLIFSSYLRMKNDLFFSKPQLLCIGYRIYKRLRGHTSHIDSLDWSNDSLCIMSVCASQEIL